MKMEEILPLWSAVSSATFNKITIDAKYCGIVRKQLREVAQMEDKAEEFVVQRNLLEHTLILTQEKTLLKLSPSEGRFKDILNPVKLTGTEKVLVTTKLVYCYNQVVSCLKLLPEGINIDEKQIRINLYNLAQRNWHLLYNAQIKEYDLTETRKRSKKKSGGKKQTTLKKTKIQVNGLEL